MICMTANSLPVSHEALTAAAQDTSLPDQVLTQWFGSPRPGNADALKHKAQWFTKSAAFDEELRGGNTLIRAVEQLETAVIPLDAVITRRVAAEQHCLAIAKGKEGPLSPFVAQMSLGLDA